MELLEFILKIVQILFWIVGATLAILTYIIARKGLLNPINTEYHKKSFQKIEELCLELDSEFNIDSNNHFSNDKTISNFIDKINAYYLKNKTIEEHFEMPKIYNRLNKLYYNTISNPFIPVIIRNETTRQLEK